MPLHSIAAQNTGNKYSQVVLHHLSIKQFSKITGHLTPHRTVFWGYWHWPQCMVAGPCLPPGSLWSKRRARPCQVHCYDLWRLQVPVGQKSRCGKVCGLSCSTQHRSWWPSFLAKGRNERMVLHMCSNATDVPTTHHVSCAGSNFPETLASR